MTAIYPGDKPTLPSFIRKIFQILNTPAYNHIIGWDKDGKSIKIFDFKDLEEEVLDQEFRHKNHRSFIRQLNMYGFKKMRKSTTTTIYFFHPLFTKDGEQNLHLIERKRENKRRLKLQLLEESQGDESKDEEFRRMKKRKAVLKFLGMEKQSEGDTPVGLMEEGGSVSVEGEQEPEKVLPNPTNAIKERKTSIKLVSTDPLKIACKSEESSKPNFELQTTSTLKRQSSYSSNKLIEPERRNSFTKCSDENLKVSEVEPFKTQSFNTNPFTQILTSRLGADSKGFANYVQPVPPTFETFFQPQAYYSPEKMVASPMPMPMYSYGYNPCMYQVPQYPMYTQPIYFAQPPQFPGYFTLPK